MKIELTEQQRATLETALNIAIDQFHEDMRVAMVSGNNRIAEQFQRQKDDCEDVLTLLDQ